MQGENWACGKSDPETVAGEAAEHAQGEMLTPALLWETGQPPPLWIGKKKFLLLFMAFSV